MTNRDRLKKALPATLALPGALALPAALLPIALLATGVLSSCGGGAGATSPVSPGAKPLFNFSSLSHPALGPAIGAWQTACSDKAAERDGGSAVERLEVSDAGVTHTIHEYDDSSCADADLDVVSTYAVSGADQYTLRAQGADIDLSLKLVSTVMTPRNGFAAVLNEVSLCGRSAWVDDQPLRVESLPCRGYVIKPAGAPVHDYLEMTGTSFTYLSQIFNKAN